MYFQTAAMLVLLGAVVALWALVLRLSRTVRSLEERVRLPAPAPLAPPVLAPAAVPPVLAARPAATGPDAGVLAAIAAAVVVAVRCPHRIVAIRPESAAQRAWSVEGRREIYQSHRIR